MLKDSIILIGAVCVLTGAWQVYPPAAWIIGGMFLFIGGIVYVTYDEQKKRGRK